MRYKKKSRRIFALSSMVARILIYIKHNIPFLWQLIEWLNEFVFWILYSRRFIKVVPDIIKKYGAGSFLFKRLEKDDLVSLSNLIYCQSPQRLDFFNPHGFDEKSLLRTFKNPSFVMLGVFDGPLLVGYFFLRCFWNGKCFVGRLIDQPYEGKGIGRIMNSILYNIGWRLGFRVLSTISKNNHLVMRSHANNPLMIILKELDNDFLLVEFKKP